MPARKPPLTDAEAALVDQVLKQPGELSKPKGTGLRAAAVAISNARGASQTSDVALQMQRRVSPRWLERELQKRGNAANAATGPAASKTPQTRQPASRTGRTAPRTGYEQPGGGDRPETGGEIRTPPGAPAAPPLAKVQVTEPRKVA